MAPILIFALLFVYYPFLKTLVNSLCAVNDKGEILRFAGLENFKYVFGRNDFKKALRNSIVITLINVPATLVLTISLALLATKKRKLSPVYETMFTLPMAVSMSAACMIFKSMFSPTLGWSTRSSGRIWDGLKAGIRRCTPALSLRCGWASASIFFCSNRRSRGIPKHIMEAAELDGAGFFTRVFKIQLPMISSTIFYVMCTNTVLAMMTSGPMIIITQGGPSRATTTLMYMMFSSGYGSSNYGLAAVVSMVAFVLTFGFTLVSFVYERKKVFYQ